MGNIMTCKINADTSNGLKLESDTSGVVDIQDNGTTRVTIGDNVDIHGNENPKLVKSISIKSLNLSKISVLKS